MRQGEKKEFLFVLAACCEWPPIFSAIRAGDPLMVRLLLANGADTGALAWDGRSTPAEFAQKWGSSEIARLMSSDDAVLEALRVSRLVSTIGFTPSEVTF